jgi:hypothetical protein
MTSVALDKVKISYKKKSDELNFSRGNPTHAQ